MATTFVDVLLQVREELGTGPLAGGKIYTYEAGTTTPLATYQDLAGATANTNPVILDSAGMAQIRQTNGVAYKWIIYDSDDNELWSRDNIVVGVSDSASGEVVLSHLSFKGSPDAQGWLGGHIFDDAVTFPIDFEGAQASCKTNPASDYVVSVTKNEIEIGTLTFANDGTPTFATTGGTTVSFSSGDQMDWYGADTTDTIADIVATFAASVD